MGSRSNEDVSSQSPANESTSQERPAEVLRRIVTYVEEIQVSSTETRYVSQPPPPGTEETDLNQPQYHLMNPFAHARISNWLQHVMEDAERDAGPSVSTNPTESNIQSSSTVIEILPSTSKVQDVVNVQLDNIEEFRRKVQEFCKKKCGPRRNLTATVISSRKRGKKSEASKCSNWKRQRIDFRKKQELKRNLQIAINKTHTSSSSVYSPSMTTFASQQQNAMDCTVEGETNQIPESSGLPLFRTGRRDRERTNFRTKRLRKRDRTLSSGYPIWKDKSSGQSINQSDSELNQLSSQTTSSLEGVELDVTLSAEEKLLTWLQHSRKYQGQENDSESSSD